MAIKDLPREECYIPGSAACPGCPATIALRIVFKAFGKNTMMIVPACCTAVIESLHPYTSFDIPTMNIAFEAAAAGASGVEAGLRMQGKTDTTVVAWAGDGGTYDIGIQALSGAMERRHDMLYVCYNNDAYMNTGIQRSSATPFGANTTTSPSGKVEFGKKQYQKNLTEILVAHEIPYVAQVTVAYWMDSTKKFEKAWSIPGPKFINAYSPCVPGWGYHMSQTIKISKMAVETNLWPLYEVENGVYTITLKNPKEKRKPIEEFLKMQVRFKHLLNPSNKSVVEDLQNFIDKRYERLELLERATNPNVK